MKVIYAHCGELQINCTRCDKQLTKRSSLNKHIQSFHEGTKFTCKMAKMCRKNSLIKHGGAIHEDSNFKCTSCLKVTKN